MIGDKKGLGLGAGIDLNIDLNLGALQNALGELTDALQQTGDAASGVITDAVQKLKSAGVQNLKEASRKEGGKGQATEAYNKTVSELQSAADRGDQEARKLLNELS